MHKIKIFASAERKQVEIMVNDFLEDRVKYLNKICTPIIPKTHEKMHFTQNPYGWSVMVEYIEYKEV